MEVLHEPKHKVHMRGTTNQITDNYYYVRNFLFMFVSLEIYYFYPSKMFDEVFSLIFCYHFMAK